MARRVLNQAYDGPRPVGLELVVLELEVLADGILHTTAGFRGVASVAYEDHGFGGLAGRESAMLWVAQVGVAGARSR